uniref:Uncharacterized protein n=1 Tax=Brassica oleracea var. oleracea TaxID=109376 RepID=A0A0D3BFF3_BRAOL
MAKKKPPPFVIRDRNTKPSGVLKAQAMRGSSSNTHTTSVTKYKNSLCKASKKLRIDSQMFSCADESCFWRCGFCELATTSKPDRSNEQTRTSNALALPCSKSTQKGVTENALLVGPTLHPKGLHKMLEDMEKDFEGGQEADKLDGGGGSKSGGSLASGALGLEWKRYKLLCVIGRWRRWSTRCDGVGRGVVRR